MTRKKLAHRPYQFLALVLAAAVSGAAIAQEKNQERKPPSVTVTGEAVITVEPDQAEVDIGVVTQARTGIEAARENAEKIEKIVAGIKKILGAGDEVKTASYALEPNYRYPKKGGKPEIVGYTATNILRVKTGALDSVGGLIDTAMKSGANRVHRLVFTLKDEQAAQRRALHDATVKAKLKAEEIARALGQKITRVLSVTEGERVFRPVLHETMLARAKAAAPQTPIEAGTIDIRSTVTLTAELSAR